ncbi:hypothetical protein ACMU_02500 [Actibacterium mucosum KCTC 23349]|uniref:Apple domain-containing protein n=1 Tax=Actibacterium mucosum KCTC 23349 TaxID=1454373 RepID=A0A037ZPD6_9RHOB|nr:alpha-2-macroglobulin family protein [Actibacterium mucosum]KAJ57393.1 hypothetical protein ACMU_02500 [Actibacterium mucosum KCTC 23349]
MRKYFSIFTILAAMAAPVQAQDNGFVPERHIAISRDVDFPGADIRSLFDTTLEACQRACLSDSSCVAFTYNTRSNSCFPKSAVGGRESYVGALSAIVTPTSDAVIGQASARAAELDFLQPRDLKAAFDFASGLSRRHYVNDWTAPDLVQGGRNAQAAENFENARRFYGSALTFLDSADLWVDYAAMSLKMAEAQNSNKRSLRNDALSASVNAYLRGANPQTRASALLTMAEALEELGRGRTSLPALRLAEANAPRDDVLRALDRAIGLFGFRVSSHNVNVRGPEPQMCADFSQDLVPAGVDYGAFVRLPESGMSVNHNDTQVCVTGLTHGERYRVTFRAGLPSARGEVTDKDVEITFYVPDRPQQLRFAGRSYVLPKLGDAALPITSVNVAEADLRLRRVSDRNILRALQEGYFGEQLSEWRENQFANDVAEEVWEGTAVLQNTLNRDVTTRLPMGDVIGDLPAGIYTLTAAIPGTDPYEFPPATQWFVISDLGLSSVAGNDGLHVFVRSLATAEASADVQVSLLSRGNRVLAETATDADGYARFDPGLLRGRGGAAPAMIVAQQGEEDLVFLSLTDPGFDLSDRGVEGRAPAGPVDVFVSTDRGAYRAGETVFATALARDAQVRALSDVPLTAVLNRPDGVEYSRHFSDGAKAGGHVFALPIGGTAPRGRWTLSLFTDPDAPSVTTANFLVEDFLPERIDFDITLPDGALRPGDTVLAGLEARYLFGAPAGGLPVEGEVALRATRSMPDWPGFVFGRHDEDSYVEVNYLGGEVETNAAGFASLPVELPRMAEGTKPVEAILALRVSEGSGRPVERKITRPLASEGLLLGLKPQFEDVVKQGTEAGFDLIALGPDGAATEAQVQWTLNRVHTRYQWYQLDGNWNWEPFTRREKLATGAAVMTDGRLSLSLPVDWGEHELVVEQTGGGKAAVSQTFYAGWYAPADTSKTPDTLELSLDKPAYLPGEVAKLRVVPRFAGTALVQVMADRLIAMQTVELTQGENVVDVPVTDDWGAGAYVTATLLRPADVDADRNPHRALGLAYATVDPGPAKLTAEFVAPNEAAPRAPLEVALRVNGIQPGETAYATIAAVDVGILNLTGFQSPDLHDHYFGQRRLGVEMRDIYGRLIDGLNGAMGQVRSGGDAGASAGLQAPPPTEELVAYFSGPVTVGADGLARAQFDLPSFNGTVRVMAVAWSPTGVGQAQADILVRDPVVVTASLPRFLAPGDESRLLLEIVHATGPAGRVGLGVVGNGLLLDTTAVPSGLTLDPLGKAVLSIPVTATHVGNQTIDVALTTPDGKQLTKTLKLPVQVNDPEVTRTSRFALAAGQSFTFDANVFAGLMPGTGQATVSVGPLARFDTAGLLQALDRYPYGCTEQITSRALPLLYLNSVAEAMQLASRDQTEERINQAIAEVLTNQSASGAFGLWRPSNGDMWLDAYVTDFLGRARSQGFDVPQNAYRAALDNLRNQVNYAPDFDIGGEDIAYALMVLAREGAAAIGDLRYYADVKADGLATPLAQAQLGAALAAYGDQTRADAMFARAAAEVGGRQSWTEGPLWRVDYGTDRRDAAAVLALAAEAGSNVIDAEAFAQVINGGNARRSTQENAWTLLAAHALIDRAPTSGITMNGNQVDGPMVRVLEDQAMSPLAIANGSDRQTTLTLTTYGVPSEPVPAGGNGYRLTRSYYSLDGELVDPSQVTQGTRLVVVLHVTPFERSEARLMVNDPLPAGFEIDNPNLLRAGDVRSLDWLEAVSDIENAEFRQDRFLAAVDRFGAEPFRLAYIVRATTPGSFRHPAASVEDMYRPDYRAWTDAGRVTVSQ